jgi:rare lipoprotein A
MRYAIRISTAAASLAALVSCGNPGGEGKAEVPVTASAAIQAPRNVSDEQVKLGEPYTIAGITYTPQDTPQYDEVGYASHYGAGLAEKPTANGEAFNPAGASAAHKTLPMPSYAEVTSLDTGRTILVRINDRGPFANDRLIDLSEGAAKQLGIDAQGVAGVRVRRVNPPEQEKSVLRQGLAAAERIETPEPLLKVLRDKLAKQPSPSAVIQKAVSADAKPASVEIPVSTDDKRFIHEGAAGPTSRAPAQARPATVGNYVAQIGAFSSRTRADALARQTGAKVTASSDGRLFRVHFGPFNTQTEAAATARQKGYPQARVYRD